VKAKDPRMVYLCVSGDEEKPAIYHLSSLDKNPWQRWNFPSRAPRRREVHLFGAKVRKVLRLRDTGMLARAAGHPRSKQERT